MCFIIDTKAKAPAARKAYKVIKLEKGVLHSPFYFMTTWYEREIKKLESLDDIRNYNKERANKGFYVVFDLEVVMDTIRPYRELAVLALDVNPKHWLYSSRPTVEGTSIAETSHFHLLTVNVLAATYKQVQVAKYQPQLQWYEDEQT